MADPLAFTTSIITNSIKSTRSLCEAIKRYKGRDRTLGRLQDEVEDLSSILDKLRQVTDNETSILTFLQRPIERCSQVCREFEKSMERFRGKSKTGFLDWTKMEFMRGDINEFIETLEGYKSTISVGLGTITLLVVILILLSPLLTFSLDKPQKFLSKFFKSIMT
jgi:hypothetical protein